MTSPEKEISDSPPGASPVRPRSPDNGQSHPITNLPLNLDNAQSILEELEQKLAISNSTPGTPTDEREQIEIERNYAKRNYDVLKTAEDIREGSIASTSAQRVDHPNLKTLSEVIHKEQWWRIYIKPEDQATAAAWAAENGTTPGRYYDVTKPQTHEGFHASMEHALQTRLDDREALARFRPDYDNHLLTKTAVNEHLKVRIGETGSKEQIDDNLATHHDNNEHWVSRTLMARTLDERQVMSKDPYDPSSITRTPQSGTGIVANYTQEQARSICDAVAVLYEKERADALAANDEQALAMAMGNCGRLKMLVHLSQDGNSRENMVDMAAMRLQEGKPPMIMTDNASLFRGAPRLAQIGETIQAYDKLNIDYNNLPADWQPPTVHEGKWTTPTPSGENSQDGSPNNMNSSNIIKALGGESSENHSVASVASLRSQGSNGNNSSGSLDIMNSSPPPQPSVMNKQNSQSLGGK